MLAEVLRAPVQQVTSEQIDVLGDILLEQVNLALWQRQLPVQISDFAQALLAQGEALAYTRQLAVNPHSGEIVASDLNGLLERYCDLPGHAAFVCDLTWLANAYACLFSPQRIGLRLRILDKAMCPRFHVDHVPVRLITSYAGCGTQWLAEGVMARRQLGQASAEPSDPQLIQQAAVGQVLLAKGEKWSGNEGAGLIHRSPQPAEGERRLLLTLDWLA